MKRAFLALALALLAGIPSPARAAAWEIDPSHSQAGFSVKHMMVANVRGRFQALNGTVEFDPAKPEATRIVAEIDAATIDTEHEKRDTHLKSPEFFDVATHPKITFASKRVKALGKGRYELVGDLTIRGVTKEVVLAVEGFDAEFKDPWGNGKMGGTATTRVNRKDFGVSWNKGLDGGGLLVGEDVQITLEIELTKKS